MTQESKAGLVVAAAAALLGVLAFGLVMPAVSKVRHADQRERCRINLKLIGLGCDSDLTAMGSFTSGTVPNPALPPERRLSLFADLLNYMEGRKGLPQFDRSAPADAAANAALANCQPSYFVCPASAEGEVIRTAATTKSPPSPAPVTHYVGVAGVGADAATLPAADPRAGVFGYDRRTPLKDITDGTSNTLLVIETGSNPGHWALGGPGTVRGIDPTDGPPFGVGRPFGGFHPDGWPVPGRAMPSLCNAAMADGSVRSLRPDTDPGVLAALATIRGGESPPADW
jgi:hypothetical protein